MGGKKRTSLLRNNALRSMQIASMGAAKRGHWTAMLKVSQAYAIAFINCYDIDVVQFPKTTVGSPPKPLISSHY